MWSLANVERNAAVGDALLLTEHELSPPRHRWPKNGLGSEHGASGGHGAHGSEQLRRRARPENVTAGTDPHRTTSPRPG
jgi:hypothetical protein